jgi:hypothetical protein
MNTKLIVATCLAACAAISSAADDKAAFEKLKALEGTWTGTGAAMGEKPMTMSVKYHVVAGGSAVQEIIAPGTPHEMVTMFYLDGGALTLTHYCVMGNQPHMKLAADSASDQLKFAFDGGTNCKADGAYMSSANFNLASPNHLKVRWGMVGGGKEMSHIEMDLTRKHGK